MFGKTPNGVTKILKYVFVVIIVVFVVIGLRNLYMEGAVIILMSNTDCPVNNKTVDFSMFTSDEIVKFENNYRNSEDSKYLDFVKRKWILAPSKKQRNLKEVKHNGDYSQVTQSEFVDNLLAKKQHGFYVECGAAEGEFISNTLFFELKRNWTGLLIEANPLFFQELIRKYRNAYSSNVCLNTEDKSQKHMFSEYSWWGGISDSNYQVDRKIHNVSVQCFPLSVLLKSINIDHVDYFSLDVEGAELEILKSIPFSSLYIDIIGIEYRVNNKPGLNGYALQDQTRAKLKQIREFFTQSGLYKEVGILPISGHTPEEIENKGLDVFFQRIKSAN